jgi:hypothetical protein
MKIGTGSLRTTAPADALIGIAAANGNLPGGLDGCTLPSAALDAGMDISLVERVSDFDWMQHGSPCGVVDDRNIAGRGHGRAAAR